MTEPTTYTEEQYRQLTIARQFGARYVLAELERYVNGRVSDVGGPDAWLTDPRRAGLDEALSVVASHISDLLLSDEERAQVEALVTMDADLDKRGR